MKQKFIDYYMAIADETSKLSYAMRLKVGSVIVREQTILATGYNGTPSGWDNNCEYKEWCNAGGWLSLEEIEEGWPYEGTYLDAHGNEMQGRYRLKTRPEVIHSESNAILKVAKSTESTVGATMFCTHAPCLDCAKLIFQSGINTLYYRNQYRSTDGIEFLEKGGVEVVQYST
jgi:dCMP deaminase